MESIPHMALMAARERGLDLSVSLGAIPTRPFSFKCLKPRIGVLDALTKAREAGLEWASGMPLPVVTYHEGRDEWEIMDGMMRICAALMAGYDTIPAYVAHGETHDALWDILKEGYYGHDFVEMLALENPDLDRNQKMGDDLKLSGV